ncbi:MAG: NUDIX domain-containing protein, partial [Clostridia bacterium]|nr:NUDIX domain-containing protein [Clostridia bacterium]
MKNVIVKTHPLHEISDEQLTFAVISARMEGKFVFGRKRGCNTWEMPGGHREPGESVIATAKRELYEETGAVDYALAPICAYSVDDGERLLYGVLFMADIKKLGPLPAYEMEEVRLFDEVPDALTYPKIQAKLSVISARHEHFG